jgi:hypothetical protein
MSVNTKQTQTVEDYILNGPNNSAEKYKQKYDQEFMDFSLKYLKGDNVNNGISVEENLLVIITHRVESDQIDQSIFNVPVKVLKEEGIEKQVRKREFENLKEYFNADTFSKTSETQPCKFQKYQLWPRVDNKKQEVIRAWCDYASDEEEEEEKSSKRKSDDESSDQEDKPKRNGNGKFWESVDKCENDDCNNGKLTCDKCEKIGEDIEFPPRSPVFELSMLSDIELFGKK